MIDYTRLPNETQERELRQCITEAQTIDSILKILPDLLYLFPIRSAEGVILKAKTPEEIRVYIERIRHAQREIGLEEPNISTRDFKAIRDFEELEYILPSFAGLRDRVRGLLEKDRIYKKEMKRRVGKTEKEPQNGVSALDQYNDEARMNEKEKAAEKQAARNRLIEQKKNQETIEAARAQSNKSRKKR